MATGNFSSDYVFEDSDQEIGSDSEDEIQAMLDGTAQQKKVMQHHKRQGLPQDSSEDEFEKEMNAELNETMSKDFSFGKAAQDSANEAKKKKEQEIENDALMYDPEMDDEDQKWVDKQRRKYQAGDKQTGDSSAKPLPTSDAVLNCPACMCAVCLDCQRHDTYENQFRAMFVLNCLVNVGESLTFKKTKPQKNKKNRKRKAAGASPDDGNVKDLITVDNQNDDLAEEDVFHPVTCSNCNTRIAVYDSDEVYHFFNVLTSHS